MASKVPPVDDMTILINILNKNIYTLVDDLTELDKANPGEHRRLSMYPDYNNNPFLVGDDDHEYVEEAIVSPLTPVRKQSAWHPDSWSPDRFSRGVEYDNEAHGNSYSPYATENVEEPSNSVHFNRVDCENQQREEHPRSTISSAEEFRLPRSRGVDDGLGIHITDDAQEVKFLFKFHQNLRGLTLEVQQ